MFGKRILVLAAHPDDEVVACAAAIGRAQAQGAAVFTLYLTDGCIARETMWLWQRGKHEGKVIRRRNEGEDAARHLGVKPLGWGKRPARHLWRQLAEVHAEIKAAVEQNKIDQLWVPAYEGGNADHDALNALGSMFRITLSVLEFAEYNFAGGNEHSQEFPEANGNEQTILLTAGEQKKKHAALQIYASEKENLNYVRLMRECWRPLGMVDYSKPPHEGTLWYARYQWVPFRHPRVDFTKAEEVSAAIVKFMSAV